MVDGVVLEDAAGADSAVADTDFIYHLLINQYKGEVCRYISSATLQVVLSEV